MKKEFRWLGMPINKIPTKFYYHFFWDMEQVPPVPDLHKDLLDSMPFEMRSQFLLYQKDKNLIPAFHDIPYCNIIEI